MAAGYLSPLPIAFGIGLEVVVDVTANGDLLVLTTSLARVGRAVVIDGGGVAPYPEQPYRLPSKAAKARGAFLRVRLSFLPGEALAGANAQGAEFFIGNVRTIGEVAESNVILLYGNAVGERNLSDEELIFIFGEAA